MRSIYIGLQHADGTEPAGAGYERIPVDGAGQLTYDLRGLQTAFPAVSSPGYGIITSIAAYSHESGGEALQVWPLECPLDIHQGVVPLIWDGKLKRGVVMQVVPVSVAPVAVCGAG